MTEQLAARGISQVAGVLLDLGVSSPQLDEARRGFSFASDGPLDMRMDTSRGETAAEWLNRADEEDIREVIRTYGEERFAKAVAAAIVDARRERAFRHHPATCRGRGSRGSDARAGAASGDPHLSGCSDSRQSGA